MAGDWIKWMKGLTHRREILAIGIELDIHRRIVASACMEFWEWADDNTTNGFIESVTLASVDTLIGITGFGSALVTVGWLDVRENGIQLKRWERYNSQSAKKRAINSLSQRKNRSGEKPKRKCIPAAVKRAVIARDGDLCRYCGWDTSQQPPPYGERSDCVADFDHTLPLSRGGDNSVANVVRSCSCCNRSKGDRTPQEAGMKLRDPPSLKCHSNVTGASDAISSHSHSSESKSIPEQKKRTQFVPPSVDDVRDYCDTRGNSVDADTFVDYYAARGWKLGKTIMKDWRAAVRTWEQRNSERHQTEQTNGTYKPSPGLEAFRKAHS